MAVKRKKTSKSKAKSKEMIQTHAMEEKESYEKTTLDQVWGDTGSSKYGTLDEDDYASQIKAMNRTDLHAHAVKYGILPVDYRQLLTSRLMRAVKKHIIGYKKPTPQKNKNKEPSAKAKSILAEGR